MPELVCAADDPRWQEERRKGVTATDITAILGLSPYESAYSLYCRKTGDTGDGHVDNDRLRLGRELEPIIEQRWLDSHWTDGSGYDVTIASGSRYPHGLYRSSARPWQMATPDALVTDDVDECPLTGVLELKSWADVDRDAWASGIPPRVRAQVLWQMDTLDVPRGHVGVLFLPSGEFRSHIVEHEDRLPGDPPCLVCADIKLMRSAARDFLDRIDRIDRRDPPPVDGSSATLAALRERFPAHKGKEAEIDRNLWVGYLGAKTAADAYEAQAKQIEAEIRVQLGEASILTVGGVKVATRVTGSSQVKAHTRTSDYIRRTPKKGNDDAA